MSSPLPLTGTGPTTPRAHRHAGYADVAVEYFRVRYHAGVLSLRRFGAERSWSHHRLVILRRPNDNYYWPLLHIPCRNFDSLSISRWSFLLL